MLKQPEKMRPTSAVLEGIFGELCSGNATSLTQKQLAVRLSGAIVDVRKMERFRGEAVENAQEEARAADTCAALPEDAPPDNIIRLPRVWVQQEASA